MQLLFVVEILVPLHPGYKVQIKLLFAGGAFLDVRIADGHVCALAVEVHDDSCDGLTTLLQGLVNQGLELPRIHWIEA
jgi:hypothetical protein